MAIQGKRLGLLFPPLLHAYTVDTFTVALSEQNEMPCASCGGRKFIFIITFHVKRTIKPE